MAGDNRLLLEFAARLDGSIKAAFGDLQQSINRLEATTRKLVGANSAVAASLASSRKGLTDTSAAASSAAQSLGRVTKATEQATVRSAEYYRKLAEITKSTNTTVAQQQTQLRALENTEKAYQKARQGVASYTAQIKALQEQNVKLNAGLAAMPQDRALSSQLTANQSRLHALQQAEKILAQNMSAGFGYTKRYSDELQKIMRLSKDFVNESQTFQKAAQRIGSLYTNKGSIDYKDHIRALGEYQREQKQKLSMIESQLRQTSTTMKNSVGEERKLLDTQLRNLREQRSAIQKLTAEDYVAGAKKQFLSKSGLAAEIEKVSAMSPAAKAKAEAIAAQYTGGQVTKRAAIEQVKDIGKAHLAAIRQENRKIEQESKRLAKADVGGGGFLSGLSSQIAGTVQTLTTYAAVGAVIYGVTAAFREAAQSVVLFDQSLKDLQAITQGTDADIAALGEKVLDVASRSKFSVQDVAESAKIIGQAGFTAAETMLAVDNAMNLAHGTMSKIETTSDLMTTVIRAFRLEASQAAEVADILAVAVNKSKLDMEKLRVVFNYLGPVALDAGISLREAAAATMVLANHGMRASTIGTSLRNIFARLQSPSAALAKTFIGTGYSIEQLTDKSTSFVDKLKMLQVALKSGTDLYKLFGLRAAGAMAILRDSPGAIADMVSELHRMGLAQEMAAIQTEGLQNKLLNLQNKLSVLFIKAGSEAGEGLGFLVDALRGLVTVLTELADSSVGKAIVAIGGIAVALGAVVLIGKVFSVLFGMTLTGALAAFGAKIYSVIQAVVLSNATFAAAATGAGLFSSALSLIAAHPIITALVAIGAAVAGLAATFEFSADRTKRVTAQMSKDIATMSEDLARLKQAREALADENVKEDVRKEIEAFIFVKFPDIGAEIVKTQDQEKKLAAVDRAILAQREKLWSLQIKQFDTYNKQIADAIKEREEIYKKSETLRAEMVAAPPIESLDPFSFEYGDSGQIAAKQREHEKMRKDVDKLRGTIDQAQQGLAGAADQLRKFGEDAVSTLTDKSVTAQDDALRKFISENTEKTQKEIDAILDKIKESRGRELQKAQDVVAEERKGLEEALKSLTQGEKTKFFEVLSGDTEKAKAAFMGLFAGINKGAQQTQEQLDLLASYLPAFQVALMDQLKKYQAAVEKIEKDYAALPEPARNSAIMGAQKEFYEEALKAAMKFYTDQEDIRNNFYRREEIKLAEQRNEGLISAKEYEQQRADLAVKQAQESAAETESILTGLLLAFAPIMGLPDLTEKEIKVILTGDMSGLPEVVQAAIRNSGFSSFFVKLSGLVAGKQGELAAKTQVAGRTGGGGGDKDSRREIDAIKYKNDRIQAENELAYARGLRSFKEYTQAKFAAEEEMYAEREKWVAKLERTDPAQGRKERESLELDKAKFELERFKEIRATEIKMLETAQATKEVAYDRELLLIDRNYTRLEQVAEKEHEINKRRIQDAIELLETKLESYEWNEIERMELENDLAKERNNLLREEIDHTNKLLALIDKHIEENRRLGKITQQQYEDFLRRQVATDSMSPTEALDKWSTEYGGFFDKIATGFRKSRDSAKSFGETVVDMAESIHGHLMDAADDFVEAWHHGTKDVRQVFKDFLEAIALDFEKQVFRALVTTVLYGDPKQGGGGLLGGLMSLIGGGSASMFGQKNPFAKEGEDGSASVIGTMLSKLLSPATANMTTSMNNVAQTVSSTASMVTNAVGGGMGSMVNSTSQLASGGLSIFQRMGSGIMEFFGSVGSSIMSVLSSLGGGAESGAAGIVGMVGKIVGGLVSSYAGGGATSTAMSYTGGYHGGINLGSYWGSMHTGGIVGQKSLYRTMSSSLLAHAPRFHNGLAPDEFPAILQRGEEVRSRSDVARGKDEDNLYVTINNYGNDEVTAEKGMSNDGERELIIQVGEAMAGQARTPGTSLNKAIKDVAGVQTFPISR